MGYNYPREIFHCVRIRKKKRRMGICRCSTDCESANNNDSEGWEEENGSWLVFSLFYEGS